jgi:hypothetical protein
MYGKEEKDSSKGREGQQSLSWDFCAAGGQLFVDDVVILTGKAFGKY